MNTAAKLNKDQIFSMLPRAAKQKLIIEIGRAHV